VLACVCALLGVRKDHEKGVEEEIGRFFENAETRSLVFFKNGAEGGLRASTSVEEVLRKVKDGNEENHFVVLVKRSHCGAISQFQKDVVVTSGCSLRDLQVCMEQVYNPAATRSGMVAKDLLIKFDSKLKEIVTKNEVLTIEDELAFLKERRSMRGAADLVKHLVDAKSTETLEDFEDVAESVVQELADLDEYDNHRLKSLVWIIERRCLFDEVSTNVWKLPRAELENRVRIYSKWLAFVEDIVPQIAQEDQALLVRLEDVLRIRSTQEEMRTLLTIEEYSGHFGGQAGQAISLASSDKTWSDTLLSHERRFKRVEKTIATRIREESEDATPARVLQVFALQKTVLNRPGVRSLLAAERETALGSLSSQLKGIQSAFDSNEPIEGKLNASPTLSSILWAKKLQTSLESTLEILAMLFDDMPSSRKIEESARSLVSKIDAWKADVFREWSNAVEDEQATLTVSGNIMEIDFKGILVVNFPEKLVTLIREVRQLQALGFQIPASIKSVAKTAERVYHYGVTLQKIATLFNNIESEIVPSQKAMLFDAVKDFETKISKNKVVWENAEDINSCKRYVEELRTAAERLSSENRYLQKAHILLGEITVKMMDTDLLKQANQWKQQWGKIQRLMNGMEGKYEPKRLRHWKRHWDHQIYKALEVLYRLGLETLHENVGEIKCEVVFSTSTFSLQYRPALEDLKTTYYRKIRKFISIPAGFKGFETSGQMFTKMADRNADALQQVFSKAEELFDKLELELCRLEDYVVLGRVEDMDQFVDSIGLVKAADFEHNLKMIKTKRKDLDRLPDFFHIDCIAVSTVSLKMSVQEQLSKTSESLLFALRQKVVVALEEVDKFLMTSMERLGKRPESIAEITEATSEWQKISDAKAEMKLKWTRSEPLRKLLIGSISASSSLAVDKVVELHAKVPPCWDNFEVALVAFHDMIKDQREALKARVDDDVEACRQRLEQFASRWNSLKPDTEKVDWSNSAAVELVLDELEDWRDQLREVEDLTKTCTFNCRHFDLPEPNFETLVEVQHDCEEAQNEWDQYRTFKAELEEIRGKDWLSFRMSLFDAEDLATKWLESFKGKARGPVLDRVALVCSDLRAAVPALKNMRGEPFKEEHWSALFMKLGIPKGLSLQNLKFGHFLDVLENVKENALFAKEMTARAQGEVTIRDAIMEIKVWTQTATVEMMEHEEAGRQIPLVKNWRDLFTELGDNQSLLSSLKESPYYKPFEQQAGIYGTNMADLEAYLTMMNGIQRKWLYLEPIFNKGALPAEANRFCRIDEDWVDMMRKLSKDTLLFSLCDSCLFPRMRDKLTGICEQLERCQNALSDFLEEKRNKLPRFFFIGDDDLLEILGQACNPTVIQSHLKKLFQGIHKVGFNDQATKIISVFSSVGEEVTFESPVPVTDCVEAWLQDLSDELRRTLKAQVVRCVHEKEKTDLTMFPNQVLCLSENIKFTSRCERAIHQGSIAELKSSLKKTLQAYTQIQDLDQLGSLKVKALVLDLVHNIDICDQLERADVNSLEDWHWDKQLRYYLTKDDACVVRICDAEMNYTYEYWGNAPKLVHTPLTDKCFLTLTQGMKMGFGGSPYGPAGTGKTESVKALGACLGRQVLVFNCDEGIDYASLGRIFTGLVKCGAWGCFDEFNRLKEDQLSAVSQQIQVIQLAIKEKSKFVKLLNRSVDVDFNAGIFVTMNPAGKGYGGRSKLPDNLKQLFRPVAMSKPDNALIAEVILSSEGFQEAKDLGQKLVSLYLLSKRLLSSQQHYDWGLRAMKAVLNTGGKLLAEARAKAGSGALVPDEEREVLIKAIRVNTLSKLPFEDKTVFSGLVKDIFPGTKARDVAYEKLETAIRDTFAERNFQLDFNDEQMRKILQLKESLDQRMGCVIVGPSGCGKSMLWKVLRAAMGKIGTTVKTYEMNPKAMPRERLLGHMDMNTREWFDGVLTQAAREVAKEDPEVHSWIICDGDVDPEWIESLNSVLDDNKLLTMPNGERISFGTNVNFLFETHDLQFASPATISRMGMIFLSEEDVDVHRLVHKLMALNDCSDDLRALVKDHFHKALDWVQRRAGNEMIVETTLVGTVRSGISQVLQATNPSEFAVGLIRGLGGNLKIKTREDFAKMCFELVNESPPSSRRPLDCFSDRGVLVSYKFEDIIEGDFEALAESGAIVKTASVQRDLDILQTWMYNREHVIVVGPPGCGKSMLLRECFRTVSRTTSVATLHCNAQTNASHVIQKIQQACTLSLAGKSRCYRPKDSEYLILYLKDVNLPKPDHYGTCMLVEFLQQLITVGGFYDDTLEFLQVEKLQIVASMNPSTTVGRHVLSSRFTACMRIAVIDYPEMDELATVYRVILENAFRDTGTASNFGKVAECMLQIYNSVKERFSVDECRHYVFTPRDLTDWILGMLHYNDSAFMDVFGYEGKRILRDRLIDEKSREELDAIISNILRKNWQHQLDNELLFSVSNDNEGAMMTRVSISDFEEDVVTAISLYEREEAELNLKLFPEMLRNLSNVRRVLARQCGSLLLVGRSGVGRRSLTMLAAHMCGMDFISPTCMASSSPMRIKAFHSDLKLAIQSAGVEGRDTVLYVEDHHLFASEVLESLNSLLCSGEVAGLYRQDELGPLLEPLRSQMHEDDVIRDSKSPYEYFMRRIRRKLHICIAMDPTDPSFLFRCESNPALYSSCTILWFGTWSKRTVVEVPSLLLPDHFVGGKEEEDLERAAVQIHESILDATPRQFVALLQCFDHLFESKAGAIKSKIAQIRGGLEKLHEASTTIDTLSEQAEKQREELREKQKIADESMDEITDSLELASKTKKETEKLSEDLRKAEEDTLARKAKIEEELSEIRPMLESAKEAVGQIRSDHLNELRSMNTPPDPVRDVLSAVLMLLGIKDVTWIGMKRFLGNRGVKEEILNFDTHRVTKQIREQVMKLLKLKASSFERATIERVSVAAAPFAAWVKANVRYSLVLDKIQPLEEDLDDAKQVLGHAQHRMQECEQELQEIDERVHRLQDSFKKTTKEAAQLDAKLQLSEETLEKAEKLLAGLGSERDRWVKQAETLNETFDSLPKQILLCAGFITYLGKEPEDIRQDTMGKWSTMMFVGDKSKFDVKKLLSSESEMLVWKTQQGLPGDDLSMENAIAILSGHTSCCPFLIDPASAAMNWLRLHLLANEKLKPFEMVAQQDARFVNKVELAVRFGKTLVIYDVDGVEPLLFPLVRRNLLQQGSRCVVQVGDKLIDFNEEFRLVLITRNPKPRLPPHAASIVNEINFTVTRSGLEGQLLGTTVQHEQPELEERKSEILKREESLKVQLADLERELLGTLASSEGNLLENKALLDTLAKAKEKSAEVSASLEESAEVSQKIDEEREQYVSFAKAGSDMFFAICGLSNVNHMYQFSLESFTRLFRAILEEGADTNSKEKSLELKLNALVQALQNKTMNFCSRAIFKRDRLMFAMHFTHCMRPELFRENEWEFLVGEIANAEAQEQATNEEKQGELRNEVPDWVPGDRRTLFKSFNLSFPGLVNNVIGQLEDWVQDPDCERHFPGKLSLTWFQRLLFVFVLRPDRLEAAMEAFCMNALEMQSIYPAPPSVSTLADEVQNSGAVVPILLVATSGADPTQELQEFAEHHVGREKYIELAMGSGQTEDALSMVRDAARNGEWLCLKNLHLFPDWIPRLEKEFNSLHSAQNGFHLWLSAEETTAFAPILLQQSIKATFEAPPGLKRNLQRTYSAWSEEEIGAMGDIGARLMLLLAWLHAVMQERRNFVPQGWTKFYEFSVGDLRSGCGVMQLAADSAQSEQGHIDWAYIHGLIENSVYGGRIDNEYDLRVLRCFMERFFCEEVLQGDCFLELAPGVELPGFSSSKTDFEDWIARLDDHESPEIFGLPQNVQRSVQRTRADSTVSALRALRAHRGGVLAFDRSLWKRKLKPLVSLWHRLKKDFGLSSLNKRESKKASTEDPVELFALMESTRSDRICHLIDHDISSISEVLKGSGLLTPQIQVLASTLMQNRLPPTWETLWGDGVSLAPKEWLASIAEKKQAIDERWLPAAQSGELLESSIDLAEIFHPGTFLNALQQRAARDLSRSMDELEMLSAWSRTDVPFGNIVRLEGLSIQGAVLKSARLVQTKPDAPILTSVGTCFISFVPHEEVVRFRQSRETISLPVYTALDRENMLLQLDLPTSKDEEHKWITAGVALFLGSS